MNKLVNTIQVSLALVILCIIFMFSVIGICIITGYGYDYFYLIRYVPIILMPAVITIAVCIICIIIKDIKE